MEKVQALAAAPRLSDLVRENASLIEALKTRLEEWLKKAPGHVQLAAKTAPLDEISIVRFILSNRTAAFEELLEKIQSTLEWRGENIGLLNQAGEGTCEPLKPLDSYFCKAYLGDFAGHCFFADRHGHNDFPRLHQLLKHYSSDSVLTFSDAILMNNESMFRKVDALGRRTDRLSKVISVSFLENMSVIPTPSVMKAVHATGISSKRSATFYPQLLGGGIVFSSESMLMRFVLKISKAVISESTLNKIIVCPGYRKGVPPSACPGLRALDPNFDWDNAFPKCANGKARTPDSLRSRVKREDED